MKKEPLVQICIVGVVIAAALFLLLRPGDDRRPKPEAGKSQPRTKLTAIGRMNLGSALPRKRVAIKPAAPDEGRPDPYEGLSTEQILSGFVVPTIKFEGVELPEALRLVRGLYSNYGGKNLKFRIEGKADGYPIDFETGGSLRSVLELLAGVGGYQLDIREGEVVFQPSGLPDDPIETVRLDVPPFSDFGKRSQIPEDPFGQPVTREIDPAVDTLARFGVRFDGESSGVEEDPETGDWLVTGSPAQAARARAVLEHLDTDSPTSGQQMLLSFKEIVDDDVDLGFESQTFADAKVLEDFDGLDSGMRSNQNIVTTIGQRARIEVVREVIYPTGVDANGMPTDFEIRNVGVMIEVEPALAGLDRIVLRGNVNYTTVGDQKLVSLFEDADGWAALPQDGTTPFREDDFRSHLTDFEGQLFDGNTTVFRAAEDNEINVNQFIHVQQIDASGQPLRDKPTPPD